MALAYVALVNREALVSRRLQVYQSDACDGTMPALNVAKTDFKHQTHTGYIKPLYLFGPQLPLHCSVSVWTCL